MNTKNTPSQEVSNALQFYIQRNGLPDKILLEVSDQLEQVELPAGMNIVKSAVRIPKNILLIGVPDEENN